MGDSDGPQRVDDLSSSVYAVLRAMAAKQMSGERAGHTLSPTALVHEAYVKLADVAQADSRAFFHAAGEAMRRILIDHARKKGAAKRGGGWRAVASVEGLADQASPDVVVALDAAFVRLEAEDERAAEVVRLRFYAGLTVDQTAEALGVSRRSVLRDWEYARAFLLAEVRPE
jgi:RNA polymerase sigma factor (TIGR02999 family)